MRLPWCLLIVFLPGCAQIAERGTAHQDREIANNMAEVEYAHRELCRQIRAETLATYFGDDLPGWHSFCYDE